jgi:Argonaute linker 1 domain
MSTGNREHALPGGCELHVGLFQSVHFGSSTLTLNIDIAHTPFLKSVHALELTRSLKPGEKLRALKGLKFERT